MTEKMSMLIGWQEWLCLPTLKLLAVKAKIDTGAKTSSLHAFNIESYRAGGREYVRFLVHPLQGDRKIKVRCVAPVVDKRIVMSSNAQAEERFVIKSDLVLGTKRWKIELTLSDRDPLRFRMLLGREALKKGILIDPTKRLCLKKYKKGDVQELYF